MAGRLFGSFMVSKKCNGRRDVSVASWEEASGTEKSPELTTFVFPSPLFIIAVFAFLATELPSNDEETTDVVGGPASETEGARTRITACFIHGTLRAAFSMHCCVSAM